MNAVIEDMAAQRGHQLLHRQPGPGHRQRLPQAGAQLRRGHAVTSTRRSRTSGWPRPATPGPACTVTTPASSARRTQLAPNITSDFDLISLTRTARACCRWTARTREAVRRQGVPRSPRSSSLNLGMSYRGNSGAPINVAGAHSIYGPDSPSSCRAAPAAGCPWCTTSTRTWRPTTAGQEHGGQPEHGRASTSSTSSSSPPWISATPRRRWTPSSAARGRTWRT